MGRVLHAAAATALVSLALLGSVGAHLERSARETTRFFELVAGGRGATLSFAIAFGEEPANEERRRMDLDHDGQISSAEESAFLDRLVKRVSEWVSLRLDGATLRPVWRPRLEMLDRRVGTIAFLVELRAEVPLGAGEHAIEVEDRLELPRAGEGEVGFKEALGGRFVDSARGEAPATQTRLHKVAGRARSMLEDRRLRFRFHCDGTAPDSRAGPEASAVTQAGWGAARWAALALTIGALTALGVWLARRGRKRA